jgi:IclR family acetate operon transcriptional repressor
MAASEWYSFHIVIFKSPIVRFMGSTKTVNTILLGSAILKVLADGVSRLEDIYRQIGHSKSTTHRILKSLAQTGLAYQHPVAHTYHIGPLLLRISVNTAALHHLLIVSAADEMRHLQERHHETSLIIIPMGDRRLVLRELRGDQQISLSLGEGSTMPIFYGSAGRVLLSQYDDRTLQKLLSCLDIPPAAPNFMSDPELRMKEISKIRERGYALSSGETLPDSAGISVPVKGYVCPAALCLFGPKFRYKPMDALNDIRESAERISERLRSPFAETASLPDIRNRKKGAADIKNNQQREAVHQPSKTRRVPCRKD